MAVFIKYLVGAFLLQGATVLLVMTTQDAGLQKSGWQLGQPVQACLGEQFPGQIK